MNKLAQKEELIDEKTVPFGPDPYRMLVVNPVTDQGALQRYGVTEGSSSLTAPKSRWSINWLLLVLFVIPVLCGGIYNFVIASDRFVSTSAFVIREAQRGGLLSLGASGGMARSDDNSFAVAEYMTSRDAVDWLIEHERLAELFASTDVDYFSRFPTALTGNTREELYRHFQEYIDVDFNSSTGISTISVQGFSPETAQKLTTALLAGGEALINDLNDRARLDAVKFATALRDQAQDRLAAAQAKMTTFRNEERVLNPDDEVNISNQLLTRMLGTLGETDAQIAQIAASTPQNPQLVELRLRREILADSIEARRASMAGNTQSLALKMEGYDRIRLERDLAEKSLINAENSLDMAEQEAQKGHLYLERIVTPSMPDRYGYPQRYLNMLLLIGICFALYWLVQKATASFRDEAA